MVPSEVVAFLTKRKVKQKIWVKDWDQGGPFVEVLLRQGCFASFEGGSKKTEKTGHAA